MARTESAKKSTRAVAPVVAIGVLVLLILEGFQTFVVAETYELTARQAYESCLGTAPEARDPGPCQPLRPVWQRAGLEHGRLATAASGVRSVVAQAAGHGARLAREVAGHLRQRVGGS